MNDLNSKTLRICFSLGVFFSTILTGMVHAQKPVDLPKYPDSLFSNYYHQRASLFRSLPAQPRATIFLGNSITDGGEWSEQYQALSILNRGISGDISAGILNRMDEIVRHKPEKLFLMIGINDLSRNIAPDSVLKNMLQIVTILRSHSPSSRMYVQSILPVNDGFRKFNYYSGQPESINRLNKNLQDSAGKYRYMFLDVGKALSDENGKLSAAFTNDGLHLNGNGYTAWKQVVYPHVRDVLAKPAIIPEPQQLDWKEGSFSLAAAGGYSLSHDSLRSEARWLEQFGRELGVELRENRNGRILLQIAPVNAKVHTDEAYRISANANNILLRAPNKKAMFYALQTLRQLMRDGSYVPAVEITDWPAFSWRGFMNDVGRNWQPMEMLKEQIDVLSRYKYNIFHFHPTEDIAWRMEIDSFPQLTKAETMLRNKGMYYSKAQVQELIDYCNERHILFLPEIDMPGHSAAFVRATGYDMQSDSGLIIVKAILRKFFEQFDLPMIHIGADEVKITNQNFLPEVSALLEEMGKTIVGWEPGGNFTDGTIRQFWMDDLSHYGDKGPVFDWIDSRHLYVNHMDVLEAPVSLFYRKIANTARGDSHRLGGTLCVWHDRNVAVPADITRMNPVYSGMVAFGERVWRGGGVDGWKGNIDVSLNDSLNYGAFESRMLEHKTLYFKGRDFPYNRQAFMQWKLAGPFGNNGRVATAFAPEQPGFIWDPAPAAPQPARQRRGQRVATPAPQQQFLTVNGGTVILRHWWDPLIKGAIPGAKDSTTWYARGRIWSHEDKLQPVWIGFYDFSRSQAGDTPPAGAWDHKGSQVWVNGNLVPPPQWQRAGQKGGLEIPLTDEGYAYRNPTMVPVKQGWNEVLIKLPVASFKGPNWHNPVKWMFTFLPVPEND